MTPKEKQILRLLSSGHTTKQISSRLEISFHTVESHSKHWSKSSMQRIGRTTGQSNAICNSEVNTAIDSLAFFIPEFWMTNVIGLRIETS